jgi:opacity protein-like surface antigen
MKKIMMLCVFIGCIAFASSAAAANYLSVKGGIFFPAESGLNDGYNLELAYGLDTGYLHPNSAVELGLGYYNASRRLTDLTVIPVTATFLFNHDPAGSFNLYGGAGVGVYFSDLEVGDFDDSDVNLGLNFVGGFNFPLSPNLAFGPELKYVVAGKHNGAKIGGLFMNLGLRLGF